jgi:hypothetical protein
MSSFITSETSRDLNELLMINMHCPTYYSPERAAFWPESGGAKGYISLLKTQMSHFSDSGGCRNIKVNIDSRSSGHSNLHFI